MKRYEVKGTKEKKKRSFCQNTARRGMGFMGLAAVTTELSHYTRYSGGGKPWLPKSICWIPLALALPFLSVQMGKNQGK